jgi:hypothetical protein
MAAWRGYREEKQPSAYRQRNRKIWQPRRLTWKKKATSKKSLNELMLSGGVAKIGECLTLS